MKLDEVKAIIRNDILAYNEECQKNKECFAEHYVAAEYDEADECEVKYRDSLTQMRECVRIMRLLEKVEED